MRTPAGLTTLVINLRAIVVIGADVVGGILVGWFPKWHSSASLVKISHLGLPWPVIGGILIACAALIAYPPTRWVGYGITAIVFLVAAWSLMVVSNESLVANGLAVAGLFGFALVLLCGVITAQLDRGRRDAP